MTALSNRGGVASATPDPRSIFELAADYRAAFARWGRLIERHSRIEDRLRAARKHRGNVVYLCEPASLRKLERVAARAQANADAAGGVCGAIELSAARIVPETLAELRASADLLAFIDKGCAGVLADDETAAEWCRSLAQGIARLTA